MLRCIAGFAAVLMLVMIPLPANAALITFDELGLTTGDTLTNQLASLGVLFSTVSGSTTIGDSTSFVPPLGSTVSGQYAIISTSSGTGALSVMFVDPSNSSNPGFVDGSGIFFDLWDTESSVTVNAYDLGGGLLGTLNLSGQFQNAISGFTGSVHRLEFVDVGGDGHVLDNLGYGEITAIPEPGTVALVGLGLLGLSLALRRRRA